MEPLTAVQSHKTPHMEPHGTTPAEFYAIMSICELLGEQLLDHNSGTSPENLGNWSNFDSQLTSTESALSDAKAVGLYFSAKGDAKCAKFNAMLLTSHAVYLKNDHGIEIVFVSRDKTEEAFKEFYQPMRWKAVPYDGYALPLLCVWEVPSGSLNGFVFCMSSVQ